MVSLNIVYDMRHNFFARSIYHIKNDCRCIVRLFKCYIVLSSQNVIIKEHPAGIKISKEIRQHVIS